MRSPQSPVRQRKLSHRRAAHRIALHMESSRVAHAISHRHAQRLQRTRAHLELADEPRPFSSQRFIRLSDLKRAHSLCPLRVAQSEERALLFEVLLRP